MADDDVKGWKDMAADLSYINITLGIISRLLNRMFNLQTSIQGLRDRVVELEGLDPDKIAHRDACSLVAEQEAIDEVKRLRAVEDKLVVEKNAARTDLAAANSQVEELERASLKDDETIERLRAGLAAAQKEVNRLRDVVRQLSVKQFVQQHETGHARVVEEAAGTPVPPADRPLRAKNSNDLAKCLTQEWFIPTNPVSDAFTATVEIEASVPITAGARPTSVKSSDSSGTGTTSWQREKWGEVLGIICDGGDWGRGNNIDHGILGALVIWADKEMDRLKAERNATRFERDSQGERAEAYSRTADELRAERDAALSECERLRAERDSISRLFHAANDAANEQYDEELDRARHDVHESHMEIERLRTRVDELERAYSAECDAHAQAQHELLESSSRDESWSVCDECEQRIPLSEYESGAALRRLVTPDSACTAEKYETLCSACRAAPANAGGEGSLVPLFRRRWLTAEECSTVAFVAKAILDGVAEQPAVAGNLKEIADQLDALLARETPPIE